MSNKQNVPAKTAHYPKRTKLLLKRTSLLIDELDVRREEEEKFQLTPYEAGRYMQLKEIFKCQRPAEPIENALEDERALKEIRKEYLTASKIKRERQEIKENADKDGVGGLLLATGTPVILVGVSLMETFMTAGIGIIVAGAAMYVPAFIREVTKKRKARKDLKEISNCLDSLSNEIDEKTMNVDKICSQYGLPINCLEREKYMVPLLEAAKEYEMLNQKETDYELLVQINGSQDISRKISKNLETILGLPVKDEKEYKKTLKKIEDQIKN